MDETFVEYAQRLRGYLGSKDPVDSLQEAPATLAVSGPRRLRCGAQKSSGARKMVSG